MKAKYNKMAGFSAVELLVVISIITLISAVVIFSFSGLNENVALNRAARELALGIRRAQNTSLATTQVPIVMWPTAVPFNKRIVRHVGIQLNRNSASSDYFLFVDIDAPGVPGIGPANRVYDIVTNDPDPNLNRDEKISGSDFTFERNVYINSFSGSCSPSCPPDTINIIFTSPEATAQIVNSGGGSLGTDLTIELVAPSNPINKRSVTVRTSGQISIK